MSRRQRRRSSGRDRHGSAATSPPRPPGGVLTRPLPDLLPAEPGQVTPTRRGAVLKGLGIVALTVAAYGLSLSGPFLHDDDRWLWLDPVIARGAGPGHYWTGRERTPDFLPVTSTAFWVQWRLFGQAPLGYRLVNLALHAAGAVMVWRVLLGLRAPGAAVAAVAFAVHPVNVATVAWISEQKNTLSLILLAGALLAWLRLEQRGGRGWYVMSLILFALACLTKASAVVLPVTLLAVAWRRRGRLGPADLLRVAPAVAIAATAAAVAVYYQRRWAFVETIENAPRGLAQHLEVAGRALAFYARSAVAPVRLSLIYPLWDLGQGSIAAAAGLGLPALAAGALLWQRRRGWTWPAAAALACYVAALAPVLGLVDLSYMAHAYVADHWHYLSLIPAMALLVGGVAAVMRRLPAGAARLAGPGAAIALLTVLTGLSAGRAYLFGDALALWAHTARVSPDSWAAHHNYGLTLVNAAEAEPPGRRQAMQDQAADGFARAIELRPQHARARYSLGLLRYNQGRLAEAEQWFASSARADGRYVEAWHGLAIMLSDRGEHAGAARQWQQVVKLRPEWTDARQELGLSLFKSGQFASAAQVFAEVCRRRPDAVAHNNLGSALFQLGQFEQAERHYRRALELDPRYEPARTNLAMMAGKAGPASRPAGP